MYRALVIILLLLFSCTPWVGAHAQELAVQITKIDVGDDEVVITYDLRGDSTAEYEATVYLLGDSPQGSEKELSAVSGDLTGRIAGTGRTINWRFREDLPRPSPGASYRFRIVVEPPGHWYTRWYVLTIAGVVAAGAVAILIPPGDDTGGTNGSQGSTATPTIPTPPARP